MSQDNPLPHSHLAEATHIKGYLLGLWPLLAITFVLHISVQLSSLLIIHQSWIWSGIKDLILFLLIFTPAAFWVHKPIRLSIQSQNIHVLENAMAALPLRTLKGFSMAGLAYIICLLMSVAIFSVLKGFSFTPRMIGALALNITYISGILIPFIATALTMTWMARIRKRLSIHQLFIGDLGAHVMPPWLLRSANRPWLIFGATSLIPVATLGAFAWLMLGDINVEEQTLIALQAVILFINLLVGGTSLIWITSLALKRVTHELTAGLNFLRQGKFDGHVAVMVDDDMGELARGLNTALAGLKEREDLKDAIAIASEIQQGLMPKDEPLIAGYAVFGYQESCHAVGGDYFDYIARNDGSFWLIIADVAGKGYPAAITVANLQAMLHVMANSGNISLIDAITYINQSLCKTMRGGRFVTLFLAELQPDNHSLNWINAGHIPPLLWRNNKLRRLEASSPPLGMLEQIPLRQETTPLNDSDALLACTDGITEARHQTSRKMFGEQRLQAWFGKHNQLAPSLLPSSLLSSLDKDGFTTHDDDITILCLKRSTHDQS